jgi:hypothetical protein
MTHAMKQWIAISQSELAESGADSRLAHREMLCGRRDTSMVIDGYQHRQEIEVEGSGHDRDLPVW